VPPEYVEGEKPTEAMLRTSDHGKHALPAAELTAIMAMERAVEVRVKGPSVGEACHHLSH
jgi:hypothetical protein